MKINTKTNKPKDPFEPSKNELEIKDIQISFDDYFQKNNVTPEAQKKIDTSDILIIPTKTENEKYYFAQESIEFIKFSRLNNSKKSIDILASGDIPVRSLHSFDIWMPIIWVASNVLFPTVVGLVANYIYDKLKGREKEKAQVDITIMVKNGKKEKMIHYKGDAKTFKKTFEKIDINKM